MDNQEKQKTAEEIKLDIEKYKHLYEYTIKGYEELAKIDKQLEEKTWKFFTVLSLLVGFQIYFLYYIKEIKISSYLCIDWFVLIISLFLLISLSINWFKLFKSVNTKAYKILPMANDVIDYYDNNELINIYYSSSKQFIQLYTENSTNFDSKSKSLQESISFIKINSLFIIIELSAYIIKYISNG